MSFLLWNRGNDARIASPRLVLRAAEVPLLNRANELCAELETLKSQAQRQIETATQAASEQARTQGFEQGQREALAVIQHALAQSDARERDRLRGEIAGLALQVVRKLMSSFAVNEQLAALALTAARDVVPAQSLVLVVHPDLCDSVRQKLSSGPTSVPVDAPALRIEVRGDAACARDACRIETEHGSVDASLETQLARLATAWVVADIGALQ